MRTLRYFTSVTTVQPGFASLGREITSSAPTKQQTATAISSPEQQVFSDYRASNLDVVANLHKLTLDPSKRVEIKRPQLNSSTSKEDIQKSVEAKIGSLLPGVIQGDLGATIETADNIAQINGEAYWQKIPLWANIPEEKFLDYKWQVRYPAL